MSTVERAISRVRRPEYTGENRCVPCTAVNVVLAAGLAVLVALGWRVAVGGAWWAAGLAVLAVGLAAIWLRGYLVPGTPTLTQRYLPERVLAAFDKAPESATGMYAPDDVSERGDGTADPDATAVAGDAPTAADAPAATDPDAALDPERLLLDAGVVEPCEEVDDLCLDEAFREAWHSRMADLRSDDRLRAALAEELDLPADELSLEEHGNAFAATYEGARAGRWESRAALVADLAAANELPDWVDRWGELPVAARSQLLGGLRIFLESCPACGGPVEAGREVVESCCRSREVVAASCGDCEARLLEVPYDEDAAPA